MLRMCRFLHEKSWKNGVFIKEWKKEHRAVLPKPDKETYHECSSYRTVSLTSILGKRFEKITSLRLTTYLDSIDFDVNQHAYMKARSSTHALLALTEKLKKAILEKEVAGVVFFDFTDAFGNVNRNKLIEKLWKDLKIRGRLFLHLCDFLNERSARIKINNLVGEWRESDVGTSAGTVLGALLFILQVHDSPPPIKPKFADDFTTAKVGKNSKEVETQLQTSANELAKWTKVNNMILNKTKIHVVSFGSNDKVNIFLENHLIEQKDHKIYLGVVLDQT